MASVPPHTAPPLIAGYHGPPELTVARAFTSWTLDLPMLMVVLLAAGSYLGATRRARRAGRAWPPSRIVFAGLGLGLLILATMSWLGVYQNVLFWVRAVQTVLLLLLVPLLFALGRPLTLVIAALPQRLGGRVEAAIRGRAAGILTFPLITAVVLIATPFLLYLTGWYAAGLHNDFVRELTYLVLIVPGFVFFWTLLRVDPVPREYPYLVALWITGAEVVFDAFLGIAIIADQHLIAGTYYRALARPWGPSPRTDQILGGGALWILGDLVGLPFLAAMLIQMIREDEAEAAEIDAELDGRETAAARAADIGAATVPTVPGDPAGAVRAGADGAPSGPAVAAADGAAPAAAAADSAAPGADHQADVGAGDRPWWETDPRFAGRFRASRPSSGQE